jgi:hypothetical protein
MYNRSFLAPIKNNRKIYNTKHIQDNENTIDYKDLIKDLDKNIDKKIKEYLESVLNPNDLIKNTDIEKITQELICYTNERTEAIPNFCTTLEELQSKLKDKISIREMIDVKRELILFINKELNENRIGGFSEEIQLIENPEEHKEFIKGHFKLKKVGKTCYKIYGRIHIDKRLDDKILTFNFPLNYRTENRSLFLARLYSENDLSSFITLVIEINKFSFCFKKKNLTFNSFVSLEHIIELLEINNEINSISVTNVSNI